MTGPDSVSTDGSERAERAANRRIPPPNLPPATSRKREGRKTELSALVDRLDGEVPVVF